MNVMKAEHLRSVYLIGIAGIGMSALARYFRQLGVHVSGYDADMSVLAKSLGAEGITVHFTEEESAQAEIPDLVVYTPAIQDTHKGLQRFRSLGIPVVKRSQMLGWISTQHQCIAVAGTHGKTTTSALIALAMRRCGVDVTAFLGGLVNDLGGNYVKGTSPWMIAEADEYDRSFHALSPEIAVVTAMDADHLDIYGNYAAMVEGYIGFLQKVHDSGIVIMHSSVRQKMGDVVARELMARKITVVTYGSDDADYVISELARTDSGVKFLLRALDGEIRTVVLRMPGLHNALNATAALAVCDLMKLEMAKAIEAMSDFGGIKRRFEVVHVDGKHTIIDDYAHHPEELAAVISAARLQYPKKKITGVFQPHLYSRTKDFYREFAGALDGLDTCILVELYPAREHPIEGVSSKMIFDVLKIQNRFLTKKSELMQLLVLLNPEVLLLLGAGDLDRMVPEIIERFKEI